MEAVFSSGDIVKQLPVEAKRFQNIDKSYMKVLVEYIHLVQSVATLSIDMCAKLERSWAFV